MNYNRLKKLGLRPKLSSFLILLAQDNFDVKTDGLGDVKGLLRS